MSHAEFVHLRLHTAYSLSEGAIHVKDLVKQCVGHKMPAVAVTDTNNMFGALEFSKYASDAGIQPIAGVTLDCCYKTAEKSPQLKNGKNDTRPSKLILLAQSRKGYGNLMRIVSQAHLTSDPQSGVQFDVKSLEGLTDDVICLTGGVSGPVGQLLLADKREEAQACLVLLRHFFVDRLYVELTRHGESEEAQVEEAMLDWPTSMTCRLWPLTSLISWAQTCMSLMMRYCAWLIVHMLPPQAQTQRRISV